MTLTGAVLVLLLGCPSGVPADSVAEFVIVPLIELTTRATIATVLVAPFARLPGFVQVTALPAGEQLHPLPDDDTYVTFGGRVSRMLRAGRSVWAEVARRERVSDEPAGGDRVR